MAKGYPNGPTCRCKLRWFEIIESGKIYKVTVKDRCIFHKHEDNPLFDWIRKMAFSGLAFHLNPLSDKVSNYLKMVNGG